MCYGQQPYSSAGESRVRTCPEVFWRGRACMMAELTKTVEPLKITDPILDIDGFYLLLREQRGPA